MASDISIWRKAGLESLNCLCLADRTNLKQEQTSRKTKSQQIHR